MLWLLLACASPKDLPATDSAAVEQPVDDSAGVDDSEESLPPDDSASDDSDDSAADDSAADDSAADDSAADDSAADDSAADDSAAPPGCFEVDGGVGALSQWSADGARGTGDGLGGSARLARDASGAWDLVVIGNSATTPAPYDTDGGLAVYRGLGPAVAWLWCDPDAGELDAMALGELDGDAGDEVAVVIEQPGLIGARVVVHESGFAGRSAEDGFVELVSEDQGAAATIAVGDLDGDGAAELITGWASQVERWQAPLPSGTLPEGDGDQQLAGAMHRWALIEDVDGDGYGDLISASYGGPNAVLGGPSGPSASLDAPDHAWSTRSADGADPDGIAVGDLEGDGVMEVAIATTAQSASDPVVEVYVGLSQAPTASLSVGETGRFQVAFSDFDGDGGDELVLGRFQYSGAAGGLLIWDSLTGAPMAVTPQRSGGLLGAALGPGVDVDGDGREELPLVDPFGAADWDPRAYLLDPCAP